jgi:hypothetical protein
MLSTSAASLTAAIPRSGAAWTTLTTSASGTEASQRALVVGRPSAPVGTTIAWMRPRKIGAFMWWRLRPWDASGTRRGDRARR